MNKTYKKYGSSGSEEFKEEKSDFYDLEYFITMEYRYLSGAHGSRVRNVLKLLQPLEGKRVLDCGSGGGFFANEYSKAGAIVTGIDYSKYAVEFAKDRYPNLDFRVGSGYDLSVFYSQKFDVVTIIDVIEHMGDKNRLFQEVKKVIDPNGMLVISTDIEPSPWSKNKIISKLMYSSERLSKEGRAYRMIKKVEKYRKQFRDYHQGHVGLVSYEDLERSLKENGFGIEKHAVYPLIGVPVRDAILMLFPKKYRGDHQCIVARLKV